MDGAIIKFGDVFRHNEKEYVFLAQTDDVVYAASILNSDLTLKVQTLSDRREAKLLHTQKDHERNHAGLSFVILKTIDFKDRAAHFGRTDDGTHQDINFQIIKTLDLEDIRNIKSEIVSACVTPIRLIEIVGELEIS